MYVIEFVLKEHSFSMSTDKNRKYVCVSSVNSVLLDLLNFLLSEHLQGNFDHSVPQTELKIAYLRGGRKVL